jgi:hypothetical protein
MAIPAVEPARIDEALDRFDREDRALPKWQGWETRESYKYAIAKTPAYTRPRKSLLSRPAYQHPISAAARRQTGICGSLAFK